MLENDVFQIVIMVFTVFVFPLMVWIWKQMDKRVESVNSKVNGIGKTFDEYKLTVAETYVRRQDFKDELSKIESKLDKIFDKLEELSRNS